MATILNATTSSGLVVTPDNSGAVAIQNNGTTAITVDTSQNLNMTGGGKILSNASNTAPAFGDSTGRQIGTLCKAWVFFSGSTGGATVNASFNVSSLTRNAQGDYTANFTNALSSANYAAVGNFSPASSGVSNYPTGGMAMYQNSSFTTVAPTTLAVRFYMYNTLVNLAIDPVYASLAVFN